MPVEQIDSYEEKGGGVKVEERRVRVKAMKRENALSMFETWAYTETPLDEPSMYTVKDLERKEGREYVATAVIVSGDQSKFPEIREAV